MGEKGDEGVVIEKDLIKDKKWEEIFRYEMGLGIWIDKMEDEIEGGGGFIGW